MANPVDPQNPNPQQPGQGPKMPKPEVQKLTFEDVFDVPQIQSQMTKVFGDLMKQAKVAAVVEKEEKASAEIHLKYLKIIQTAERHKHTELLKEKKEMLHLLEEEMRLQKNLAMGAAPKGPAREAAGKLVESDFAKKMKDVESVFNKKIQTASMAAMVSEGGLGAVAGKAAMGFDALIASAGELVSPLGLLGLAITALVKIFFSASAQLVAFTRLQTQFRAAGRRTAGVSEGGEVVTMFDRLQAAFRGLGEVGADEEIRKYMTVLTEAPKALDIATTRKGVGELKNFTFAMADMGISVPDSMKMIAEASNDLNMSTKDLTDVYKTARSITGATGINSKSAFNTLLNMNAQLRSMTFNAGEASKVLMATAIPLEKMGFSATEIQRFATNLSQVLGSMSPTKMSGLMAFTKGILPTDQDLKDSSQKVGGVLNTFVDYFRKALKGTDPTRQLITIQKIAEQVGFTGATTMKGAEAWKDVLDSATEGGDSFSKAIGSFQKDFGMTQDDLAKAQRDGYEALKNMTDPLTKLQVGLESFFNTFSRNFMPELKLLNDGITSLVQTIGNWKISNIFGLGGGAQTPGGGTVNENASIDYNIPQQSGVRRATNTTASGFNPWTQGK